MPANSWPENNSFEEFEPLHLILSAFEDSDQVEDFSYPGYLGRRLKAAVLLLGISILTLVLHFLSWGYWLVLGFTALLALHAIRIVRAKAFPTPQPLDRENQEHWPQVSLLVAAKNEEAVIDKLIHVLCNLDYPRDRYEVWAIDDNSSDRTPQVLQQLAEKYDNLNVFRRSADATGGKSGALNQVIPLTHGEFIGVFDADAQVSPDFLQRVLPTFHPPQVGAVQMRKAIANPGVNFWTKGQVAEMALDSYFQQQRIALGGIGELRGNGQFIRRQALDRCGGFNEETITDDLDLTMRLHLDRWDVQFISVPVKEEGVTRPLALWHQRNRWGEGGYQRYLDYWRLIFSDRLPNSKSWDMFAFWIIQYFLPAAAIPDLILAIGFKHFPIYSPLTTLAMSLSLVGMFTGLRRIERQTAQIAKSRPASPLQTLIETVRGIIYLLHWVVVISSITLRISVRPKQLKWVKTVHQGSGELPA